MTRLPIGPKPSALGKLALGAVLFLALVVFSLVRPVRHSNQLNPGSQAPGNQVDESKMSPEGRQAEEDAAMPQAVKDAEVGVTTRLIDQQHQWPCVPNKSDLFDLMELQYAQQQAIENHSDDFSLVKEKVNRFVSALSRTKSIVVPPSAQVIVLEKATDARRVTIIRPPSYISSDYQYAAARSCWVTIYAVARK